MNKIHKEKTRKKDAFKMHWKRKDWKYNHLVAMHSSELEKTTIRNGFLARKMMIRQIEPMTLQSQNRLPRST
jgi:hypothetical protein